MLLEEINKILKKNNEVFDAINDLEEQTWGLPNEDIFENDLCIFKRFKIGSTDTAQIVTPPMAGHHSNIAERVIDFYCKNTNDSIYSFEWKPANDESKNYGIENIIESFIESFSFVFEDSLVLSGLCQGGWANTIYAALYPNRVKSCIIAGTPIDFKIDGGKIQNWLSITPDSFFKNTIKANNGIWPGEMQLTGFKMLNPVDRYCGTYLDLYEAVHNDDEKMVKKWKRNNSWYEFIQDLPGKFIFPDVITKLFRGNYLIKNKLVIFDRIVNLANIECPFVCITGDNDDITLERQCTEAHKYISSKHKAHYVGEDTGHIGIFLKTSMLQNQWKSALNFVTKHSK